jgi:hypothetical protein
MPSKLERGWVRARLIRQLALAEATQTELAAEYGCDQSAIALFLKRHKPEVEYQRGRLADEWAGLWIADKRNRVAEYQSEVERINSALDRETDPQLLRAKVSVMRQVAEELGQLKQEIEVTGTLTYVVEGVDMSTL